MRYWALIILTVLLFGCESQTNSCFNKAGSQKTKDLDLKGYHSLAAYDGINVTIKQDSFYAVTLTGPEFLLPFVKIEIIDSTIHVSESIKCDAFRSFKNEITLSLTQPILDSIIVEGYGDINSIDTLKGKTFRIDCWDGSAIIDLNLKYRETIVNNHLGVNDITLHGNTKYLFAYNNVLGWIYMENYDSEFAWVNQAGTGDIILNCSEALTYSISDYGNLQLVREPNLIEGKIDGEGELIILN